MNNWFSTLPFLSALQTMRILSILTFPSNRLDGYPLIPGKDLKKRGLRLFDYWTDYNTKTHLLKWFDNKFFQEKNAHSRKIRLGTGEEREDRLS